MSELSAEEIRETLDLIHENHRRIDKSRSLRKQYQLIKENELLFAKFGVRFPPMHLPGIIGWWLRRGSK